MKFEELTPAQFETLVSSLLRAMGYDLRLETVPGPNDKGKDVVATPPSTSERVTTQPRKWIFQCKRKKKISPSEITAELDRHLEPIDGWTLVTTARPTNSLLAWVRALDDSGKYRFRIDAWWKDDIDRLVGQYQTQLHEHMPRSLAEKLRLAPQTTPSSADPYGTLLARLRLRTADNIKQFAASKFIPGLYVSRGMESVLGDFHSLENARARTTRGRALSQVESHVQAASAARAELQHIGNIVEELTGSIKRLRSPARKKGVARSGEEHEKELKRLQDKRRALDRIHSAAKPRCDEVEAALHSALRAIRALSVNRIAGEEASRSQCLSCIEHSIEQLRVDIPKVAGVDRVRDAIVQARGWIESEYGAEKSVDISIERHSQAIGPIADSARSTLIATLQNVAADIRNIDRPALVIVDRAGGGKTNLICAFASKKSQESPTLLFFGKDHHLIDKGLVGCITEELCAALRTTPAAVFSELSQLLQAKGEYLHILIDGINENRRIPDLDRELAKLLPFAAEHRIRVTLTCRDIYYMFFEVDTWAPFIWQTRREQLFEFTHSELDIALPLYLEAYKVDCKLGKEASERLRHPLLMRFFCEAYGDRSSNGPPRALGVIPDIHLRKLFDLYLRRKAEEVRRGLGIASVNIVLDRLCRIASEMLERKRSTITTTEYSDATGDRDLGSRDSIYVRLLDEYIIIDERPADSLTAMNVSFVYEQFMEYIIARTLFDRACATENFDLQPVLHDLRTSSENWVNARGTAEFLLELFLADDRPRAVGAGVEALRALATRDTGDPDLFWRVVGRLPERATSPETHDLLHSALWSAHKRPAIRQCAQSLQRLSSDSLHELASVMLWSTLLPPTLRWSRIASIRAGDPVATRNAMEELLAAVADPKVGELESVVDFGTMIGIVKPLLDHARRVKLEDRLRLWGGISAIDQANTPKFAFDIFVCSRLFFLNSLAFRDSRTLPYLGRLRFAKEPFERAFIRDVLSALPDQPSSIRSTVRKLLRELG